MCEEHVVRTPCVHSTSLMQAGMPVSGATSPAAMRLSAAAADAIASSSVTVTYDRTRASTAAMRSSTARVSSTELTSRRESRPWASVIVRLYSSGTCLLFEDGAHPQVPVLL